jgi:hypothetical protein
LNCGILVANIGKMCRSSCCDVGHFQSQVPQTNPPSFLIFYFFSRAPRLALTLTMLWCMSRCCARLPASERNVRSDIPCFSNLPSASCGGINPPHTFQHRFSTLPTTVWRGAGVALSRRRLIQNCVENENDNTPSRRLACSILFPLVRMPCLGEVTFLAGEGGWWSIVVTKRAG